MQKSNFLIFYMSSNQPRNHISTMSFFFKKIIINQSLSHQVIRYGSDYSKHLLLATNFNFSIVIVVL